MFYKLTWRLIKHIGENATLNKCVFKANSDFSDLYTSIKRRL